MQVHYYNSNQEMPEIFEVIKLFAGGITQVQLLYSVYLQDMCSNLLHVYICVYSLYYACTV